MDLYQQLKSPNKKIVFILCFLFFLDTKLSLLSSVEKLSDKLLTDRMGSSAGSEKGEKYVSIGDQCPYSVHLV